MLVSFRVDEPTPFLFTGNWVAQPNLYHTPSAFRMRLDGTIGSGWDGLSAPFADTFTQPGTLRPGLHELAIEVDWSAAGGSISVTGVSANYNVMLQFPAPATGILSVAVLATGLWRRRR